MCDKPCLGLPWSKPCWSRGAPTHGDQIQSLVMAASESLVDKLGSGVEM